MKAVAEQRIMMSISEPFYDHDLQTLISKCSYKVQEKYYRGVIYHIMKFVTRNTSIPYYRVKKLSRRALDALTCEIICRITPECAETNNMGTTQWQLSQMQK